jgi:hypothetical protein
VEGPLHAGLGDAEIGDARINRGGNEVASGDHRDIKRGVAVGDPGVRQERSEGDGFPGLNGADAGRLLAKTRIVPQGEIDGSGEREGFVSCVRLRRARWLWRKFRRRGVRSWDYSIKEGLFARLRRQSNLVW